MTNDQTYYAARYLKNLGNPQIKITTDSSYSNLVATGSDGKYYTIVEVDGLVSVLDSDGDPVKMLFSGGLEAAQYIVKVLS